LAYPIRGHRKGTYWLTYFRLEGGALSALKHRFQLSESILRFLFVKVDPRIVDTLVQHALAGPAALAAQHQAAEARHAAPEAAPIEEEAVVEQE
jgi:small subunit ribosomal protein S6